MRFIVALGNSLTVLSSSQVHVANTGDKAHLQCLFLADNFNLFDYPVLWRKSQLHEDVQVFASSRTIIAVVLIFLLLCGPSYRRTN